MISLNGANKQLNALEGNPKSATNQNWWADCDPLVIIALYLDRAGVDCDRWQFQQITGLEVLTPLGSNERVKAHLINWVNVLSHNQPDVLLKWLQSDDPAALEPTEGHRLTQAAELGEPFTYWGDAGVIIAWFFAWEAIKAKGYVTIREGTDPETLKLPPGTYKLYRNCSPDCWDDTDNDNLT